MGITISANVTRMFEAIDPYYVSNNAFTLGESVGKITWQNALTIAKGRKRWLRSPVKVAVQGMRENARERGYEAEEIAKWTTDECIALFVQDIANELRTCLDVDNSSLEECVAKYARTDWDREPEYPIGAYYIKNDSVFVQFYTGI